MGNTEIAAQQQKVEELKEHKKDLMQKLFPMCNERAKQVQYLFRTSVIIGDEKIKIYIHR